MAFKPVGVTKINNYIKSIADTDSILRNVSVEGEISNLTIHSSGHIYFSLKDEQSSLRCFLPKEFAVIYRDILKDGLGVIAQGSISVYVKQGYFSLNVAEMTIEGRGALDIAFDEIKNKLEKEGLFDFAFKRSLPNIPQKIGIVTSKTGAALQDILKVIRERNQFVEIFVFPALVQGENAKESIKKAIELANRDYSDLDVLIVGRGGGSKEDLWCFNEEIVARSIFESKIPIISAVGHEIDVTIADMVADMRAATPTQAAQIAVPKTESIIAHLDGLKDNINQSLLDIVIREENKVRILEETLRGLDPKNAIDRGFGAILDEENNLVKSIADLKEEDTLNIMMKDGSIRVKVVEIKEK